MHQALVKKTRIAELNSNRKVLAFSTCMNVSLKVCVPLEEVLCGPFQVFVCG